MQLTERWTRWEGSWQSSWGDSRSERLLHMYVLYYTVRYYTLHYKVHDACLLFITWFTSYELRGTKNFNFPGGVAL